MIILSSRPWSRDDRTHGGESHPIGRRAARPAMTTVLRRPGRACHVDASERLNRRVRDGP
ncbi:hypothetical protein FAIPA1_550006 [Frankia sp. AiPs1]